VNSCELWQKLLKIELKNLLQLLMLFDKGLFIFAYFQPKQFNDNDLVILDNFCRGLI